MLRSLIKSKQSTYLVHELLGLSSSSVGARGVPEKR